MSHCWWQIGYDSAWGAVALLRPLPVMNWDDMQLESDPWAYIILLALERYRVTDYKDCGIGWLVLISIKVKKEENRLKSSNLKSVHSGKTVKYLKRTSPL